MHNRSLPRILKIQNVEPFTVRTLWNNGEIREIDFDRFFALWREQNNAILLRLTEFEDFKQVSVSESKTLEWKNLTQTIVFNGALLTSPIELDPDVLYENSSLATPIIY